MINSLISVIVPVYNVDKYLKECIESIINQTYTNLEIILVDDGSIDDSGSICDEYEKKDNRVKVIHKKNEGVSVARNIGLEIATGEWIGFIDSDDWIEVDYFTKMIKIALEKNVEIVVCGYNRIVNKRKESINNSSKTTIIDSREYLIKTLNPQTGYGFCHSKLYKRESIGDVVFDSNLVVGEDALFNEQIATNIKKCCMFGDCLYNYRLNSDSAVKRYDPNYATKYLKSMEASKNYLLKKYNGDNDVIQNYYNLVAFHVLLIAVNYCFNIQNNQKNKIKSLKEICEWPEFKDAIRKCNYNNISLTRKITLFTIKSKLYLLTAIICIFRQKQMKGWNKWKIK